MKPGQKATFDLTVVANKPRHGKLERQHHP